VTSIESVWFQHTDVGKSLKHGDTEINAALTQRPAAASRRRSEDSAPLIEGITLKGEVAHLG
jgi:hypothetical protein